jgi:hypothetical protein
MKTFSDFKTAKPAEVQKTKIQEILSELSVMSNADLTDKKVEIAGLEEVEAALVEHIEAERAAARKQVADILSDALQHGKPLMYVMESIVNGSHPKLNS